MPEFRVTSEPDAPREDRALIADSLDAYNIAVTGVPDWSPIRLFIRDDTGAILGGLLGDIWGGVAEIGMLWVGDSLRGQGYGSKLLAMAEDQARQKGCYLIHLDTFSFQAPEFYQQRGYEVFGKIEDYPRGHTRYYMKKAL